MCIERLCLQHLRGRTNEVCCGCSTLFGVYLICVVNWVILVAP